MRSITLSLLLLSLAALGANEYKQPAPSIFYSTITMPALGASGIVTNTAGGLLGTVSKVPVANGGTNSSNSLFNNRFIVSSGGTLGEAGLVAANKALASDSNGLPVSSATTATELGFVSGVTSSIQTQINSKQATITVLPIANGGTNSGNTLVNNRFIVSSGGTIGEGGIVSANSIVGSDSNGLPKTITIPLSIANGGTNTSNTLKNNRFIVSSGGTLGEGGVIVANSIVGSDSNGLPTTIAVPLPINKGGTNTLNPLANNMVIVSSGGTIGEINSTPTSGYVLTANGVGSAPTWKPVAAAGTAGFMGSVFWAATAASYWRVQSASFVNMTVNGTPPTPTVTNKATDPGTHILGVKFASMAAGTYRFVLYGAVYQQGGNQTNHAIRFTDGTNNTTASYVLVLSASSLNWSTVEGIIRYGSPQTNVTIQVQGLSPSSDTVTVDNTLYDTEIDVYYYPDA